MKVNMRQQSSRFKRKKGMKETE